MRRFIHVLAAGAAATALAGCHPAKLGEGRNRADRPETVRARLDCPDRQGEFTRTGAGADGRTCTYLGQDGSALTLGLYALNGRAPQAVLQPLEDEARRLAPVKNDVPGSTTTSTSTSTSTTTTSDEVTPPAPPKPPGLEAGEDDAGEGRPEHVHLDLPGLHIDANDGGQAQVRAFGHTVEADEGHAVVKGSFNGSQTSIEAGDGGAVMRFGSVGVHAVDLTFVVAADKPGPEGVKAAGYVARGPVGGPLVVATVRSPRYEEHIGVARDDAFRDAKRLVARNLQR